MSCLDCYHYDMNKHKCYRYPEPIMQRENHYCGEFQLERPGRLADLRYYMDQLSMELRVTASKKKDAERKLKVRNVEVKALKIQLKERSQND